MESMIEAINRRVSVRKYTDQPIEPEKRAKILELLRANTVGPFGNKMRFELIDFGGMERGEVKNLGTYGFISGATLYVAGAVKRSIRSMEDTGYCFEKVILGATNLGLGTCWMGGTFKRATFAKKINVSSGEIVPVISPIGYAHEKRTLRDRALRRMVGSDKRKPWEELFFEGNLNTSLKIENAGKYATPLECLRLGPSASNNQPWRIVKSEGKDDFHLFLKRTWGYDMVIKSVDLQQIDMGIAMCHFELAAKETGLTGRWEEKKPDMNVGNMEYIITWESSS